MSLMPSTSRGRTIAGLVILAGLAPFLLALMACLPVPVGDPEKSQIDPALTGVWRTSNERDETLWIIEPWDAHTWLLTSLAADGSDSADVAGAVAPPDAVTRLERGGLGEVAEFKTWLANFGDVRFLVLEPKVVVREKGGMKPELWFVYAVTQPTADRVELRPVDYDIFDDVKTTAEAEAILTERAKDPTLYEHPEDPTILLRVQETEYGRIEELLKTLAIGVH